MAQDDTLSELNKIMGGAPQEEKKPVSKPMSPSGFVENTLENGFNILKGLYQIIPTTAGAAREIYEQRKYIPHVKGKDIFNWDPDGGDPNQIIKGQMTGAIPEVLKQMIEGVKAPYVKHGARVLYEEPLTVVGDALGAWGMAAKSIGMAGRMAGGVASAKPLTLADRVVTLAQHLEDLPGTMARKGIDKGVLKATGGRVDLAKRREFLALQAEIAGEVPLKIKADYDTVGKKVAELSEDEAALFHKWRTQGASAAEASLNPKVADALESWRKVNAEYTATLKSRRFREGMFNDEHVQNVLERKFAAEVFGKIDDATMAEAKAAIGRAEIKPVYGPSMFEKKGVHLDDIIDDMLDVQGKKPKGAGVSFLEEFTGKEGSIKDPRVYILKHIQAFRNVEARLKFRDALLKSPELSGAPAGMKALEGPPPPGDISKRYYQDKVRWEQASQMITDPTIKRLLQLQNMRVTGPLKPVLRVYDAILNAFRKTATVMNPRYYIGNAVGDAVLGMLAGSEWTAAQKMLRKGTMPPNIMNAGSLDIATGVGGMIEKFKDFANSVDVATKAGIVSKAVRKHLMRSGMSFEKASEAMEPVLRSTQAFNDLKSEMQLLQENIARSSDKVRRLDAMIERTKKTARVANEKAVGALHQRVVNLETMRSNVVRDLADDMVKNGHLEARVPELRAQVAILRPAVERANAFVGDYLGLDGFEQGVMRRLIPFYAWSKAMTMLAFRMPFLAPVKSFLWHRYSQAMMSMVGDKELPPWMDGSVPVFARENGDLVWFKLGSYSPFSGLRTSKVGGIPVPSQMNLAESSPFFNVAFKIHGGKTIFDRGTMPYAGESLISIGDGTEYRWRGDGSIEKGMAQAPLVSSVAHMFPITQFLEEAILPFKVNKYGWGGIPEPQYNSDGSFKYPREWWQRLASAAGVNLQSKSREDVIRSAKVGKAMAIRAMKGAYRKANQEERTMILSAMKDYLHGQGD